MCCNVGYCRRCWWQEHDKRLSDPHTRGGNEKMSVTSPWGLTPTHLVMLLLCVCRLLLALLYLLSLLDAASESQRTERCVRKFPARQLFWSTLGPMSSLPPLAWVIRAAQIENNRGHKSLLGTPKLMYFMGLFTNSNRAWFRIQFQIDRRCLAAIAWGR
jgi:hypothetical protein